MIRSLRTDGSYCSSLPKLKHHSRKTESLILRCAFTALPVAHDHQRNTLA